MTPKDRKVALLQNDVTMAQIARELGVTTGHVSQVVRGLRRSPTVEQAIARAIGEPVERVFAQATVAA